MCCHNSLYSNQTWPLILATYLSHSFHSTAKRKSVSFKIIATEIASRKQYYISIKTSQYRRKCITDNCRKKSPLLNGTYFFFRFKFQLKDTPAHKRAQFLFSYEIEWIDGRTSLSLALSLYDLHFVLSTKTEELDTEKTEIESKT